MMLPEDFKKITAFLCVEERDDFNRKIFVPHATGFFVSVPLEEMSGAEQIYFVTARHNIDESRECGDLCVRLNTVGDGFYYQTIAQDDFYCNPSTDVAIALFPTRDEVESGYYSFRANELARVNLRPVFSGEDVLIAGLFSPYPGIDTKNQPIMRFGKIALPQQKIPLSLSPMATPVPVDAFLVESLSWGGESGSPVYIERTPVHFRKDLNSDEWEYQLIGLVHGHYPIHQKVKHQRQAIGEVDLNAGIMVVIPLDAIIETLMMEDVIEQRKQSAEQLKRQRPVPTPD